MSREIEVQIREYAQFLDEAFAPEATGQPQQQVVSYQPDRATPRWRLPGWAIAAVAALAIVVSIGGVVLLFGGDQSDDVAPGGLTDDDSCWLYDQRPGDHVVFTVAPTTGPRADCPEPEGRWEIAWVAMLSVLDEDHFAGMWWENDMQDLVVAYVGQAPNLDDLPGVTRLVERDKSLKELDALARERNNAAATDVDRCWRVDYQTGTLQCSPPNFDDFDPGL